MWGFFIGENTMESKNEFRSFPFEIRAEGEGKEARIVGHAAVFNTFADIWDFREQVAPGAFRNSIQTDDIRALFNHNPDHILGRNRAGTLKLAEDEQGLAIEITPPDTQLARDLIVSMKRGDISQMSFGFQVLRDEWNQKADPIERTLKEVKLFDVSPVTFPAYPETDVSARNYRPEPPQKPEQEGPQVLTETPLGLDIKRRRLKLLEII